MKSLEKLRYSDVTSAELKQLIHHGRKLRAEALMSVLEKFKVYLANRRVHGGNVGLSGARATGRS